MQSIWDKAAKFHGHECPGLAIGVKVCEAAMKKLKIEYSDDENIVCVAENDSCSVDAVQAILGCTLGKGNLVYRDRGKMAFSFFRRDTGESLRIILKPMEKSDDRKARQEFLLNADIEELFIFQEPGYAMPEKAQIFESIICETCGEKTSENKIRLSRGKKLCLDCFAEYKRGW